MTYIFQCRDPQMTQTRAELIEFIKKALQSTNVPDQVAGPFVEMVRFVSDDRDIIMTGKICHLVAKVIEDQQRFDKNLLIRGFLSKNWLQAIAHYTKVQIASKSSLLVSSLWKKYFFPVWNQ